MGFHPLPRFRAYLGANKHIARFFPPDLPPGSLRIATRGEHEALASMVVKLSARFEALVNNLAESKVLSDEQRANLLGKDWQGLLDETNIQGIMLQLQKVYDVEEEL